MTQQKQSEALEKIADVLEQIGIYAFGTDAVKGPEDCRSNFEVIAVDLPEAINEVARSLDRIADAIFELKTK